MLIDYSLRIINIDVAAAPWRVLAGVDMCEWSRDTSVPVIHRSHASLSPRDKKVRT